jgi:hypothetical protein
VCQDADADADACVLLAAHGDGADALARCAVLAAAAARPGESVLVADTAAPAAAPRGLPAPLLQLPAARAVARVPLGGGARPRGMLLLAKRAPQRFDSLRWQVQLQAATLALLRLLGQPEVGLMAELIHALDAAADPVAMVSLLLRVRRGPRPPRGVLGGSRAGAGRPRAGSRAYPPSLPPTGTDGRTPCLLPATPPSQATPRYVFAASNLRMSARLALLPSPSAPAALLFESPPGGGAPAGGRRGGVASEDASAGVVGSRMTLDHTLLASALKHSQVRARRPPGPATAELARQAPAPPPTAPAGPLTDLSSPRASLPPPSPAPQARFVRHCGQYIQSCARPVRDLFGRTPDVAASLLVIPFFGGAGGAKGAPVPVGGMYFALDEPGNFDHLRDTLLVGLTAIWPGAGRGSAGAGRRPRGGRLP